MKSVGADSALKQIYIFFLTKTNEKKKKRRKKKKKRFGGRFRSRIIQNWSRICGQKAPFFGAD